MKWIASTFLALLLACTALAQSSPAVDSGRLFLPKNFIWGYGQFDVAPPHNEPDPNLCAANAGSLQYGGRNAPCTMFARYMLWGYVEVRPFARTPMKRLMLFGEPRFLFGKNLPQTLYTWSMQGMGWERSWGAGIDVGHGFEARVTQHYLFQRFGSRDRNLGPADLGVNGPWGRYTVIGVRKYFGYRREGQ